MERNYIQDVISNSGRFAHPRIMLRDLDFKRIAESDDPIYVFGRKMLISNAEKMLTEEPSEHVIPDGIRLLDTSRRVYLRMRTLGMAYQVTGDERYAERAWVEMEKVCSFPDWNPRHFLDVGEMCNALGIGYDWIYDWLNAEQKATVRKALFEKGFEQAMDDYKNRERSRTYRWYQDNPGDNWKFVCNGGITVAALAICDEDDVDEDYIQTLLDYAFDNTYRAVRDMYMPDGSYVEGFMYWTYATEYLACYAESLKTAVGTDYGLTDYAPVKKSPYYLKEMSSGRFYSFNFGDAVETYLCSPVYMWVGHNYGAADIIKMRAEYIRRHPDKIVTHDLMWYRPFSDEDIAPLPLDCGQVGSTNASFRAGWDEGDLFGAIHFGGNDVCHAHADMGVFVIEWDGKRFICDLGPDNYNVAAYRRVYRYRAEGHNTLVINPDIEAGQERYCECYLDKFHSSNNGSDSYAVCDMSAAYPGKRVVRGMKMTAERRAIVVQDEIGILDNDVCYWYAHTAADITISEDKKSAVLNMDGSRMWVGVLQDGEVDVMEADYHDTSLYQQGQRDNSDFKKLFIKTVGSAVLSVAFMPLSDGENEPKGIPVFKKITEW